MGQFQSFNLVNLEKKGLLSKLEISKGVLGYNSRINI